ncbi:hypothetical protein FH972_024259 [Carpinus fangiana]|uniref:CFEM domain-containing protein n=1 Tax=Carpinus fangiana TaxID=176857 RepID=A0A5N6KXJ0_9ROSI|nr:hypothetical protein FH972_024259 [Carpinus fangiana]
MQETASSPRTPNSRSGSRYKRIPGAWGARSTAPLASGELHRPRCSTSGQADRCLAAQQHREAKRESCTRDSGAGGPSWRAKEASSRGDVTHRYDDSWNSRMLWDHDNLGNPWTIGFAWRVKKNPRPMLSERWAVAVPHAVPHFARPRSPVIRPKATPVSASREARRLPFFWSSAAVGLDQMRLRPFGSCTLAQKTVTMKFAATILLGAVASFAVAQTAADIPQCALPCFINNVQKTTGCGVLDTACQCKDENRAKLEPVITPCVQQRCPNVDDQLRTFFDEQSKTPEKNKRHQKENNTRLTQPTETLRTTTGICAQLNGASPDAISSAEDAAQSSAIAAAGGSSAGPSAAATGSSAATASRTGTAAATATGTQRTTATSARTTATTPSAPRSYPPLPTYFTAAAERVVPYGAAMVAAAAFAL